jgi:transposase InsO family protein
MSHARPRLSVYGRLLLVQRVAAGRPVAHVAAELGVSRATAYKWVHRFAAEGEACLVDRSTRPHSSPSRTPDLVEARILKLRRQRRLGPARIAGIMGLHASTVHRVLTRHHVARLSWLDRPSATVVRRYERERPGDLIHMDVKKLGRIPVGGGWRGTGDRAQFPDRRHRIGYDYVHSAVDDHSRLAYSEIHPDEKADTVAGFTARALAFFAAHGVAVRELITDNAWAYRHGRDLRELLHERGIAHRFIQPYRPQTNGKVERFNRTLLEEWAYARPFTSGTQRSRALTGFLHTYNHHRAHTALGGHPPISRVDQVAGQYS